MPLLGKFIKKIMNYGNFWVCKPPFLKPEQRGCGPGNSSSTPNLKKNNSRGFVWQIVTKKFEIFDLHFYSYNVEICLKEVTQESLNDKKFSNNH